MIPQAECLLGDQLIDGEEEHPEPAWMAMVSRVVCVLREARQHDLAAEIAALLWPVSQAYEGDLP